MLGIKPGVTSKVKKQIVSRKFGSETENKMGSWQNFIEQFNNNFVMNKTNSRVYHL